MIKKRFIALLSAVVVSANTLNIAYAKGISYLPDVTQDMTVPNFWTVDDSVLMSPEEINLQNHRTVSQQGTNMYDLKNQKETVDTIALNDALKNSSLSDAKYYTGWTYVNKNTLSTEEDFAEMISNTQNPNPGKSQKVLYGIAVNRTVLRAFPSNTPIYDDPNDKDFDYQFLSSIRVNEPLVITSVSNDGKYYLAKNICCSGWISANDIAICKDKEEWLSAWDIDNDHAVVVWGDKVYTETSNTGTETSNKMLPMGTVLRYAETDDSNILIDNRAQYQNYVVWLPIRHQDGSYGRKLTLIPQHNKVSLGYLPMTKENIAKVAFSALGNTYGWGGSLLSDDCSGYIRNIYKCFGLELARNTLWQCEMPMAKADMQFMCKEERKTILDSLPFGSILYFNGHEMLYLGKNGDNYYVISSISSIMQPDNPKVRQRIRSIVINTLDIKRANGNTWLDDLTAAVVPYEGQDMTQTLNYQWYHDGVSYCIKNNLMKGDPDKNFLPNNNITHAEVLQILLNLDNLTCEEEISVSDDSNLPWYKAAADFGKKANLIPNDTDDQSLQKEITREELCNLLYLYANYKNQNTDFDADLSKYTDLSGLQPDYIKAFKYAVSTGILTGKTSNTLNPKDATTRAETATVISRFAKLYQ